MTVQDTHTENKLAVALASASMVGAPPSASIPDESLADRGGALT